MDQIPDVLSSHSFDSFFDLEHAYTPETEGNSCDFPARSEDARHP